MGWLPVKHFAWREPPAYRREVRRASAPAWWRAHRRASVVLALALTAVAGVIRLVRPPGDMSWPVHLGFAAVGGLILPWLDLFYRYLPVEVSLDDRALIRTCANHADAFAYAACRDFGLVDRAGYRILLVGRASGRDERLGVPVDVDVAGLADFLGRQGLARLGPAEVELRLAAGWPAG